MGELDVDDWKELNGNRHFKKEWVGLLDHAAEMHIRCTRPPSAPFPFAWEEIGTGYCYGPAFGHWDIVHAVLDQIPYRPQHVKHQLLNNLAMQSSDGMVPGVIWMAKGQVRWSTETGHPPVWPVAVQDYMDIHGDVEFLDICCQALVRQIGWFEHHRKADNEGYMYTDIVNHSWESGVDDGIRFDQIQMGAHACVDATSHVYQLYVYAGNWLALLGKSDEAIAYTRRSTEIKLFIQQRLFDEETGFFVDIWAANNPEKRRLTVEGIWPMVVGAATVEQANRLIHENLLVPERFFTKHPIPSVALSDPGFELRMWRGPTWNSMTYWAARGCVRYHQYGAAIQLLERALDMSAETFKKTGKIWEFYHPIGGSPTDLERKPYTAYNTPCSDYLGHNPVISMANLWNEASAHI
jgi:putative isomerase